MYVKTKVTNVAYRDAYLTVSVLYFIFNGGRCTVTDNITKKQQELIKIKKEVILNKLRRCNLTKLRKIEVLHDRLQSMHEIITEHDRVRWNTANSFEIEPTKSGSLNKKKNPSKILFVVEGTPYIAIKNEHAWCRVCNKPKQESITGQWYCPEKHGDGTGENGIMNQPQSNPEV